MPKTWRVFQANCHKVIKKKRISDKHKNFGEAYVPPTASLLEKERVKALQYKTRFKTRKLINPVGKYIMIHSYFNYML